MRVFFAFVCFSFCLTSCLNNKPEEDVSGIHPDLIYHDYKITGEENRGDVTMMLQFRLNGADGNPVLLEAPSKISLDGIEIKPDSAKLAGVFYELVRPVEKFKGEHRFVFTDSRGKEHTEEFSFEPFTLKEEFPEELQKMPFTIRLSAVPEVARVHLVMIDTSFTTPDVNEQIEIEKGEIQIGNEHLANLADGPIMLEIYMEMVKPLKNLSREGGQIRISYGLRRQFDSID